MSRSVPVLPGLFRPRQVVAVLLGASSIVALVAVLAPTIWTSLGWVLLGVVAGYSLSGSI